MPAEGLQHDGAQRLVNGRLRVGLITLLVAQLCHPHQPGRLQASQFPLQCPLTRTSQTQHLIHMELPIRLAKQQPQHLLLAAGEQGIGHRAIIRSHIGDYGPRYGGSMNSESAGLPVFGSRLH